MEKGCGYPHACSPHKSLGSIQLSLMSSHRRLPWIVLEEIAKPASGLGMVALRGTGKWMVEWSMILFCGQVGISAYAWTAF